MKKLLSLIMVAVLIFSIGVTVFAAENDGSITISNATIGKTYKLYKLFDASYSGSAISYSMEKDSQFYSALFNEDGTPATGNVYFTYVTGTKEVSKVNGANDTDLLNYVKSIVQNGSFAATRTAENVTVQEVVFDNIPYGYYIIDVVGEPNAAKGMITVTSNAPDSVVIDKNQLPFANGIEKKIWDESANNGQGAWADENTAFVGDIVKYRVSFNATNYSGMEQIRYYTIHDTKGNALWVEFGNDTIDDYNIVVKVGNDVLSKGYYHLAVDPGEINTTAIEWSYLGDWSDVAESERDPSMAEWYLVHYGYDEFEIVIPWLNSYTYVTSDDDSQTDPENEPQSVENEYTFELEFANTATSKFDSNVSVEVVYYASVEPNADIGKTDNLFNSAYVKWTGTNTSKTSETDTVYTHVEGLGIHKMDAANNAALSGVVFEIYKDEDCTIPLYVIPTGVEGVYVYDDLDAEGQKITGKNKATAREAYAAYLAEYLGTETQKNVVVTPVNGKIVITGLKAGTYYVKEVTPPAGYNSLTSEVDITVGSTTNRFYIYAAENGKVDNLQAPTAVFQQKEYIVEVAEIYNSQGTLLPSTGGEGTFWMITIGTLLVIGFAVFLITHKKMSVYVD